MNYVIITGASKGLGEAVVKELLQPNFHLICVSRRAGEFPNEQELNGAKLDFIPYDLSNIDKIDELTETIFSKVDKEGATSIHFINNAGVLTPMKPLDRCEPGEIVMNLNVNLVAPMLLTSLFIKNTKDLPLDKRVINISSGAGKHPIYGWSCYGASKAGINLMSQTGALEQEEVQNPVKIVSFAPGIIDTQMQQQIRSSKKEDFAQVDRFIDYKNEGQLLQPETVARVVGELLTMEAFPNGQVVSVNEYL
ncbi:benzil reductase ((S)-benzoin forming) [Evansella vedderi]|uniref:Benzil reductase ((S)-benzoin forming) n=1 Tax=Evansella vedderi TaxID=38282 RepID=A0ABT9ZT02_9BACI|nr:(S)-benzoin forming benzil reductase [Evansella vedderi]MDQ0253989.1 benzil reductase ((S)-benzoin forming) [Evansella vedderi]